MSLLKELRSIDNFSGDSGPQFLIVPVINRSNRDQTPAFYGKREEETERERERERQRDRERERVKKRERERVRERE